MKLGRTAVVFDSAAVLSMGADTRRQREPSARPLRSSDALPSSMTVLPTSTDWSGPASASDAVLGVPVWQLARVHLSVHWRASSTLMTPLRSASRGSARPSAGWLRAA